MEIIVVLLLLTSLDNNSELSQKLRSALDFYRQNRELITMFTNSAAAKKTPPSREEESGGEKKESRTPEETSDSMKILEEYLKRAAV